MRLLRVIATCLFGVVVVQSEVLAQSSATSYPSKPVLVILPYAAGSPLNTELRIYTKILSETLGKPFIIDTKPGAGSTIGVRQVAKAPPDGHTLGYVGSSFAASAALYSDLGFDPLTDIAPVSMMYKRAMGLFVPVSFPPNTWPEFISYVKANPGKVNYATTGLGSVYHLMGESLASEINGKVTFIHYKGAGPMQLDLVAGRVDAMGAAIHADVMQQIRAGKVKAIAVLATGRSDLLPDLKTVDEQGLKGFDVSAWGGMVATGGTPLPIITKLSAEMAKIAKLPELVQKANKDGTSMVGSTPDEFKRVISSQVIRWRKVVSELKLTPSED